MLCDRDGSLRWHQDSLNISRQQEWWVRFCLLTNIEGDVLGFNDGESKAIVSKLPLCKNKQNSLCVSWLFHGPCNHITVGIGKCIRQKPNLGTKSKYLQQLPRDLSLSGPAYGSLQKNIASGQTACQTYKLPNSDIGTQYTVHSSCRLRTFASPLWLLAPRSSK